MIEKIFFMYIDKKRLFGQKRFSVFNGTHANTIEHTKTCFG